MYSSGKNALITRPEQKIRHLKPPVMVGDAEIKKESPVQLMIVWLAASNGLGWLCRVGLWFFLESGTSQNYVSPGILTLCFQPLLKAFTGKSSMKPISSFTVKLVQEHCPFNFFMFCTQDVCKNLCWAYTRKKLCLPSKRRKISFFPVSDG